jgi:hyaluronan synthase
MEQSSGIVQRRPRVRRVVTVGLLLLLLSALVISKGALLAGLAGDPFLEIYGALAGAYFLSRCAIALCYRAPKDRRIEPRIAVVMPAFNEQDAIARSLRSLLAADYPADMLQIVAVDDGSTDDTLAQITEVARHSDGRVRVIAFAGNQGKRAAMAAGIRATDAEIVAFVDSDSTLRGDALRAIVQPFADRQVGAVCGQAEVLNARDNWLTKMQAVRYCVSFRVVKAAESVFGAVTCCSGCFAAYRREAILPSLDWWSEQRFLGRPATIGDDRSLTNCVLRSWRVVYHGGAVSRTAVPDNLRGYIRQQTRWKRSWTRESLLVGRFIWRKHPAAAAATYVGMVLPLAAPFSVIRALAAHPITAGGAPALLYGAGLLAMALVPGILYLQRARGQGGVWLFGVTFVFVYLGFLVWLTYYAILTCRSSSWCTRSTTLRRPDAGAQPARVAAVASEAAC